MRSKINKVIKCGKYIKLITSNNKEILIDSINYKLVSSFFWGINTRGYAVTYKRDSKKVKCILIHRLIMKPKGNLVVDHKNGNKLDNRISNLRVVTQAINVINKIQNPKSNTGFWGISFLTRERLYRAEIACNSKKISKRFKFLTDAVKWRKEVEKKLHIENGYNLRNLQH